MQVENHWVDALNAIETQQRIMNTHTVVPRHHRVWRTFTAPIPKKPNQIQICVWEQIRRIPCGETWTYDKLVNALGQPQWKEKIRDAVCKNPYPHLALVRGECTRKEYVPCHRVVPTVGPIKHYLLDYSHDALVYRAEVMLQEKAWAESEIVPGPNDANALGRDKSGIIETGSDD